MATNNRGRAIVAEQYVAAATTTPKAATSTQRLDGHARERPIAAAAAVGGAVAAGVFLWSRRNQISDQIGNLSDQISEWREGCRSGGDFAGAEDRHEDSFIASPRRRSAGNRNQSRNRRGSADLEGDRQGRRPDRGRPVGRKRRGAFGRPFFIGQEPAIASPNSGLVT